MKNVKDDIIYEYPVLQYYPIVFTSVKNNLRTGGVLKNTLDVYKKISIKISTKNLNDQLKKILAQKKPPAVNGKEIKIKYISQVHSAPPVFAIFTNYPEIIPISYRRYLLNQLRQRNDIIGATIKLSFRKK